MTNWRELGFVPNSDDEDSDAELSTQEDEGITEDLGAEDVLESSTENLKDFLEAQVVAGTKGKEDGVTVEGLVSDAAIAGVEEDTLMEDADVELYVDIDSIPEALSEIVNARTLSMTESANQLEPHSDDKAITDRKGNYGEVLVIDLSSQPDTPEDQVQLVGREHDGERSTEESRNIQGEKNIVLHGVESQLEIPRDQPRLSPDPIAIEEQAFPQNWDEDRTTPPGEARGPSTPVRRQESRQPTSVIGSPSMIDSSPLSSVSSGDITPPPPPCPAPQKVAVLPTAFQIVIPTTRDENHEQWAAPIRTFRERKPIQKNPYLIEEGHYRQTLKSRGVRPLKITEVEQETDSAQGVDQDSQGGDYVAPPEPSHQPRPQSEDEMQLDGEENAEDSLPPNTNTMRERPRPNSSLSSETKRRKMAHTYSKRTPSSKINETPRNSTQRKENILPLATQIHQIENGADIYDMPMDSSPRRPARRPLAQTPSNQPISNSSERHPDSTEGPKAKHRGILAVMDSDSESDPGELNETARPVSPASLPITILSSPPQSPGEVGGEEGEEGDEEEEEEEDEEDDEEDESQMIRTFQRKTTGVLPASWWKLDKNQQTGGRSDTWRGVGSAASVPDVMSKPGVARAKISSRARSPDADVFLMGDDDSDMSSDEPVTVTPTPTKNPTRERDAPRNEWIDLDDIIEDDRIDRMIPSTSRKGIKQKKRKRNQTSNSASSHRGLTAGNGGGYTSTPRQGNSSARLHQPKITDHVSSKKKPSKRKKPTAPRVGIVDAVRHYQAITAAPPPTFIKLAERRARERRDQGRQSPSRKLFILETEIDTRDVQAVMRDWREGTLGFVDQSSLGESYGDSSLSREGAYRNEGPSHQLRLASPQRLSGSQVHSSRIPPSTAKPSQPRRQGGRQTTLSNIVRREPISKKLAATTRPRPKSQANPVTSMPGRGGFVTHRPKFPPQAAQFETEKPMNNTLRRLHQAPRRPTTPDLATLLRNTAQRNPHLARFMEDDDLVHPMPRVAPAARNIPTVGQPLEMAMLPKTTPRAPRKRIPRRVDADTIERRQPPPQDIVIDDVELHTPDELPIINKPTLQGLLQYGKKYSLTFDIVPLKSGTIFNSQTFIGDGGLSRALNTLPVKGSRGNQGSSFTFGDNIIHWGSYEDSVAAEFETIMNQIADTTEKAQGKNDLDGTKFNVLTSEVYSFSRFFSNYLARVISFPDSIDIVSFGQRILQALDVCCSRVLITLEGNNPHSNPRNTSTRLKLQLLAFSLVFILQIYRLSSEDAEVQARLEIESSMRIIGQRLLSQLLKCGVSEVRACYEDQRQRIKYERGIDQEHYIVEAWVIAIQTLGQAGFPNIGFWQLFNVELRPAELKKALDIRFFEKNWRITFTILPLHQFDSLGFAQQPSTNGHFTENWALLKALISRPLNVYNENPEGHFGTIIDYCRVLYARCHHLISLWGWKNPDAIIPVLYDFFVKNSLANLKNEKGYGSVEFLQDLERNPSLAVQDSDRCFHLLLKTVAIGIKTMETTSTTRKIEGIVNRIMPNHRRQYPKEEALRIEHLNALRNHHDLVATLYWAAPPNCRPPLEAIRDLVDPEFSHLQACNVSIRTWSNLLRFKLHSGEDLKDLEQFVEWFDYIVSRILNQHNTARSEAERIFKAAKDNGNIDLSEDALEGNIRSNQKQLEDILVNAVRCLNTALSGIVGQTESAVAILTKASTSNILNSYNRLSPKLVIEVLHLVQQYLRVCKNKDNPSPLAVQIDEDSQDYGDCSGFDDLVVQDAKKSAAEHLLVTVYDSLHRMLSNYFGADKQSEETLLVEVVDTWALVIEFLVQSGLKKWDTYLDSHSSESWSSLRDTEQTRKFTAYFMLKIIQTGADVYEANKATFISFWLKTLVERESMLKFQNEYTAELLNRDPENLIFENLPFARDELSGNFSITRADFRLRRLSLISTVLANMRESYETARDESPAKAGPLKQEYSRMLKSMMKSMKDNYEELQTKAVSGAYVEFVQQVIGYLQQHTIDLVNVDGFFTNPNLFPLPATDPTYVVGKLKNYGLKLHNQRGQKQLTSFFQSVCERAAVDGQQEYLVSQLTTALSGSFEDGDPRKPTLRAFFIGAVFPTYVEYTFREPCGWILAVPILKAAEQVITMIREDIDSTFYPCVSSVLSMLTSLLDGMRLSVSFLKPSQVLSPSVLGPLTIMFSALSRVVPIIDWLSSSGDSINALSEVAYDCVCFLIKYSGYIRDLVENRETQAPIDVRANQMFEGRYETARKDYTTLLRNSFKKEWSSYGGSWFVVRGAKRSEVQPPIMHGEQEGLEAQKQEFTRTVENLLKVACRTQSFEIVGWSVDASIWEYEGRGMPHRDGVRGRKHGRALRTLGNLFC